MKRLLDAVIASVALVALSPVLLLAAIGIKLTNPGSILYRAPRIARDRRRNPSDSEANTREVRDVERRRRSGYWGREFTMYKFRTMQAVSDRAAGPITARNDARVFPFGKFLRATKLDELPQLLNVLKGDMTLVGPRPEAPEIVRSHYTHADLETLRVRPGVTSPGTVYYYTHCESTLAADGVLDQYVRELLPIKLALDRVYLERATFFYDLRIVLRTFAGIIVRLLGTAKWFPDPPELQHAQMNRLPAQVPERISYSDVPRRLHQHE